MIICQKPVFSLSVTLHFLDVCELPAVSTTDTRMLYILALYHQQTTDQQSINTQIDPTFELLEHSYCI